MHDLAVLRRAIEDLVVRVRRLEAQSERSWMERVEAKLDSLITKENTEMALGEDILAKVTEADTKVDSVIALLNGLVASGTIPKSVADAIFAKIQGSEDKLDAAIAANTTPPPTP